MIQKRPHPQPRDKFGRFAKVRRSEPINSPVFRLVTDQQRTSRHLVQDILRDADEARRRDPRLQTYMRRDADIMAWLTQRQMSVALMEWDIEADNPEDPVEMDRADQLRGILDNTEDLHELKRHLLEAVWYGRSGANIIYDYDRGMIRPVEWVGYHPDSVVFSDDGRVGLKVAQQFHKEGREILNAWNFRVMMLDQMDRRCSVIHTQNRFAPDYDDPDDAEFALAGRGLRDTLYYTWLAKQTALREWQRWLERFAGGLRVARYQEGNEEARKIMEDAARNWSGNMVLTVPHSAEDPERYNIEVIDQSGAGSETFEQNVKFYTDKIKAMILGQTATTEATSTGLGSSVGDKHEMTYWRIIKYDALTLGDTLTRDLIRPMFEMNYPGASHAPPRFKFSIDRPDPEAYLESVEKYVALGGRVASQDVRDVLGLRKPEEGEDVLAAPDIRSDPVDPNAGLFDGILGG